MINEKLFRASGMTALSQKPVSGYHAHASGLIMKMTNTMYAHAFGLGIIHENLSNVLGNYQVKRRKRNGNFSITKAFFFYFLFLDL